MSAMANRTGLHKQFANAMWTEWPLLTESPIFPFRSRKKKKTTTTETMLVECRDDCIWSPDPDTIITFAHIHISVIFINMNVNKRLNLISARGMHRRYRYVCIRLEPNIFAPPQHLMWTRRECRPLPSCLTKQQAKNSNNKCLKRLQITNFAFVYLFFDTRTDASTNQ